MSGNLSWQYGNDEDPFCWQQRDGSLHCLYHNGRGGSTNHGLHAFSTDGKEWHKPADALLPQCASLPHTCSSLYTDKVELDDGRTLMLSGRERPALLFDEETGAPTVLYNGAIDANRSVPWYAMAQRIRIKTDDDAPKPKVNFALILTDDQDLTLGSMEALPRTQELLGKAGATLSNWFIHTSVCCPSRSELLTSRYFHNLRVNQFQGYPLLRNDSKNAGDVHGMRPDCVRADDPGSGCCMNVNVSTELQDSSFAGVLQKAGWRTGMFGKYLNSHVK